MTAKEVLTKNIVYERLTSETPDFWKRIRFYAQVGTVLVSILGSIAVPLSAPLWVGITIGALDALCVSTIALSSVTTLMRRSVRRRLSQVG